MTAQVKLAETFVSIQGESSYAGLTCFFIRLAGCNLSCRYCDTPAAREPGRATSVEELADEAGRSTASIIEITGGEPLIQEGAIPLADALQRRCGRTVLIETNGSQDLGKIPEGVIAIVDIKTPGSGEVSSFDRANLSRLRPYDEMKFVLQDRADYEWARNFLRNESLDRLCRWVFFSPVHGMLEAGRLGAWMIEDGVTARLQVQLHKVIGLR